MNDDTSKQNQIIEILIKLQEAESEIIRLKEVLEKIEKEQYKRDSKMKKFESTLNEQKNKMLKISSGCQNLENELKLSDDRIVKSNEKLRMVKTNKEYQLYLREVDDMKKRKDALETSLIELLDEKEKIENLVKESEKEFELLESQVLAEKNDIEKKASADKELLEEYLERRTEIGNSLEPSLMKRFLKISKMNQGLAVVQVKDEACMGCFMNIPPQLYIEVQRGNTLISCPQCSRFLYFKKETDSA
jgi:uncharacterized protein